METASIIVPPPGQDDVTLGPRPLRAVAAEHDADLVRVFDADPDLLIGVEASACDWLRHRAVVPRVWVDEGKWHPPVDEGPRHGWFGLLVIDGLMIRSLHVEGRSCPELIGAGDLLRPWDRDANGPMPIDVSWTALERTTLAVLDDRFTRAACRWPTITSQLLGRSVQRSRTLAFHLAIVQVRHADTRLRMLLWHLADRWGRVTPSGVHLPLALTHETLAHLVCMQRPTASSALQRLTRAGEIGRRRDGSWMLTGTPPGLVSHRTPGAKPS